MVRHGKPGIMLDRIFSEHKLCRSMVKVLTAAAAPPTAVSLAAPAPTACSGLLQRHLLRAALWAREESPRRMCAEHGQSAVLAVPQLTRPAPGCASHSRGAPRTPEERLSRPRLSPWQSDTRGSHALPATRAKVADVNMVRVLAAAAAAATAAPKAAPIACSGLPSGPGRRALAACVLKRACISALVPVHCRRFYRR